MGDYQPETYWTNVASRAAQRGSNQIIAGDDEPFYEYKRSLLLKLLDKIDYKDKEVLEVGVGPGGNLLEVYKKKPKRLCGADISQAMIDLATKRTPDDIEIRKSNGSSLPYEEGEFDIVFCVTVLQHVTDEKMLDGLIASMCKVSRKHIYIYERIERSLKGNELNQGRPISWYEAKFRPHGYRMRSYEFININISYYVCGAIRKLLNPASRAEGAPLNKISIALQRLMLPITRWLDTILTAERDLACIAFEKNTAL